MFFDFHYLLDLFPQILKAFPITFFIVLVSTLAGSLLGLLLAVVRLEKVPILNQLTLVYTSFVQGTPVIIQLFIVYYGVPYLLGLLGIDIAGVSKLTFMYIAYSLSAGAYFGEIIRSAIANVPRHQFDAAYSIGMDKVQTYRYYILPQSVKEMIPNIELSIVSLLQNSSLATYLGIYDIMGKAQLVGTNTAHQIEAFIDASIIFIVLSVVIHLAFKLFFGADEAKNEESLVENTASDLGETTSKPKQSIGLHQTSFKESELSYE